jgi:SsrA-binding protein
MMPAKSKAAGDGKPKSEVKRTLVANNKKAYHEYHVLETFKAGIVLTGTEIKSIRKGKANLNQAFARIEKGEVFLYGMHIAPYEQGTHYNHDPDRVRKLLLTKKEIKKLLGKTKEKGLTLIPLKLYIERAWAKVDIGLCKGKQLHDKRDSLKEKTTQREIERALKSR